MNSSSSHRRIAGSLALLLAASVFSAGSATSATGPLVTNLGVISTGVRTPIRIAGDSSGNIFVADPRSGGVNKYNPAGTFVRRYATTQPAQAVALDATDNILVSQGKYVSVLDKTTGAEIRKLGSGIGQFQMANGICVLPSGEIYVADSLAKNVNYFTSTGAFTGTFGLAGTTPGTFTEPVAVAYEKEAQQLAVADSRTGWIQFFTKTGGFVKRIGIFGSGPGSFTSPQAVSFEYDPSGALARIYVLDSFQSIIQTLDSSGTPLPLPDSQLYIGGYGKTPGKLINPSDFLFDPLGRRLVVANNLGNLTLFGIDGGTNPVFTVTPGSIPQTTSATSVTITGTLVPGSSLTVNGVPVTPTGTDANGNTTWTATVTPLATGPNQIVLVSRDTYGNTTSKYYPVNVVTGTPTPFDSIVALSGITGGTVSTPTQNISGTASSSVTELTLTVTPNSGTFVTQTVPVLNGTFSAPIILTGTSNTIQITANPGAVSKSFSLNYNPELPTAQITTPLDGSIVTSQSIAVQGSATGGTVSILVNGVEQATSLGQTVTLQPGMNTVIVMINGNPASKATVSYNPGLGMSIASPPADAAVNTTTATITGTTSAAAVRAVLYDPISTSPTEIPVTLSGGSFTIPVALNAGGAAQDGIYRLTLTTYDSQNNQTTVMRNLVVDTVVKPFTLTTPATGTTLTGNASSGQTIFLRDRNYNVVKAAVATGGAWSLTLPQSYDPATMNLYAVDAAGTSSRNGDLNSSGAADIADATLAIKMATNQISPTTDNFLRGDVAPLLGQKPNPNGVIDGGDVGILLRKLLGLITY